MHVSITSEEHRRLETYFFPAETALCVEDETLEYIISELRKIDHVEIVRLGSRTPVVMPMRITDKLVNMLKKYHPIWLNTHFNHPKEMTPDCYGSMQKAG